MLNSITWGQYITAIVLTLIFYYVVIGYKYFKWEILALIGIKKIEGSDFTDTTISNLKQFVSAENPEDYLPKPASEVDISPLVQSFTDEVKAYVQQTTNTETQKNELVHSLSLIASKYVVLKHADCRNDLEFFVLNEANKIHPNIFQPKDVTKLWN